MPSLDYRADIDGLRAVAVIPVVLFHLQESWLPAGYLGVDLFFVLSGFLITGILVRECRQNRFSYRHFLARRVRRIAPVLISVIATTLAITVVLVASYRHPFVGEQATAALLSLSNLYYWNRVGDYWGPTANESVLLHCWSLAIEEQFYLFFPWIVHWGHRIGRARFVTLVAVATFVSLAGYLFAMSTDDVHDAFYLMPYRAWQLLAGSLAAIGLLDAHETFSRFKQTRPQFVWAIPNLGLLMILVAYLIPTSEDAANFGPVSVVLGTVMLLLFPAHGLTGALLTSRPMVYVGKISYSIYLWHWPIVVYATDLHLDQSVASQVLVIFFTSIASYHAIEQTTRYRPNVLPWIGVAFVGVLGGSVWLATEGQFVWRSSNAKSEFARPVWHGGEYNLLPSGEPAYWQRLLDANGVIAPPRTAAADSYREGGIYVGSGDTPEIVLLGDSHGAMYAHEIRNVSERLGKSLSIWTVNGASPFFSVQEPGKHEARTMTPHEKRAYDVARIEKIAAWKPDVIIIAARWWLWRDEPWEPCIDYLSQHAKRVILIGPLPESSDPDRMVVEALTTMKKRPHSGQPLYLKANDPEQTRKMVDRVIRLADRHPHCHFVPMDDLYGNGDNVLASLGDETVYLDDDHLTNFGVQLGISRIVARWSPP